MALGMALSVLSAACTSAGDSPDLDAAPNLDEPFTTVSSTTTSAEPPSTTDGEVDEPEPRLPDPAASFTPTAIEWTGCDDLECASIRVPTDYSDPARGTIELAVIRSVVPSPDDRVGSLFMNFGGPGGKSKDSFPGFVQQFRDTPFGAAFDLVAWDPRGVGDATALPCTSDAVDTVDDGVGLVDPSDGLDDELADEKAAFADLIECASGSGALLDNIGTVDVARDLDVLRRAMGDEPLNYLGFSYGSEIGWVYATMFPEGVRAMVLDGVVDPVSHAAGFVDQYAAFERTFAYFDEVCGREPDCALREQGLASTVDRVASELADDPISLADGTEFGEERFLTAVLTALYGTPDEIGPILVRWIQDADAGDPSGFVNFLNFNNDSFAPGAYEAVLCADGFRPRSDSDALDLMNELIAAAPRFGRINEVLLCGNWPGIPEPLPKLDTTGAPPILVVGNTLDPATPYEAGQRLSEQLADGALLTYVGPGHTIVGDDRCIDAHVANYLLDVELPPTGTECGGPGLIGVQLEQSDDALVIVDVVSGGGADEAGLEDGDVLVSIDGRAVSTFVELPPFQPGQPVDVDVGRDGERVVVSVDPQYRPWH